YWFEYGTTPGFGASTAKAEAGQGQGDVTASATINGLQPNTTYYVRLVAENAIQSSYGATLSFKTPQELIGFQANTGSLYSYQSSIHAAIDANGGMAPNTS